MKQNKLEKQMRDWIVLKDVCERLDKYQKRPEDLKSYTEKSTKYFKDYQVPFNPWVRPS